MPINPRRGEIWRVDLDPTRGSEMRKSRPVVVISSEAAGRLELRLVVPLTGWNEVYGRHFWMTRIEPNPNNGLSKASAADAFQMRSVALERFTDKLGALPEDSLQRIAKAIALTIEYDPEA